MMASWAVVQRAGIAKAKAQLDTRVDTGQLVAWIGEWLTTVTANGQRDRAAAAAHPATGTLIRRMDAAQLSDIAGFLRAFAAVEGPIHPGVWAFAQLLGCADAAQFASDLIVASWRRPNLFGLESFGASDARRNEILAILRSSPETLAAARAEITKQIDETCDNPGHFAVFARDEGFGVATAIQKYVKTPAISEAWETRLDSHVCFEQSFLLEILRNIDVKDYLDRLSLLPHPVFLAQIIPDQNKLAEPELLELIRRAPEAFDQYGAYRPKGMIVVRLLKIASKKIRVAAWGEEPFSPIISPDEQAKFQKITTATSQVVVAILDALFDRDDAVSLAWAWLERLIFEGEHRGHWRCDRQLGNGLMPDPLAVLITQLADRLTPRPDRNAWVSDNRPLWRIDRAMAALLVTGIHDTVDQNLLQSELEWTLTTLAPSYAGAADAVTRPDCLIGRLGAHCLLRLDQPGFFFAQTWQKLRPLRERAWRHDRDETSRHNVAELLILWGLLALEAAPSETRETLWCAFDDVLLDATQVDRVAMADDFWRNMMHRYALLLPRLLQDRDDAIARLSQTLRPHIRPDLCFVDIVLVMYRCGVERTTMEMAVAASGADLLQTVKTFFVAEERSLAREHLNPIWVEEAKAFADSFSGSQIQIL